jgi:hypothetical protein
MFVFVHTSSALEVGPVSIAPGEIEHAKVIWLLVVCAARNAPHASAHAIVRNTVIP